MGKISNICSHVYIQQYFFFGFRLITKYFGQDNIPIESFTDFKKKRGIFADLSTSINPYSYWEMAESGHKNFSDFALKMVNIPGSSAEIERFFGDWSRVHSAIRNRLSKETSKKLVHVYYSLKKTAIEKEEALKPRNCETVPINEIDDVAELSADLEGSLNIEAAEIEVIDEIVTVDEDEDPDWDDSEEDMEDDLDADSDSDDEDSVFQNILNQL